MLVLSRKPGEKVYVGGITVQVVAVQGNRVRLAIDAPEQVAIVRAELKSGRAVPGTDPDNVERGRMGRG
jgi:carbon storage regulator